MATDLQYREGLTDTQKNQLVTRLDRIKGGSAITDTDKANFNYGLGSSWQSYLVPNTLSADDINSKDITPVTQPADPTQAFMSGLAGANAQNQAQLTEQQQRLLESQKLMQDAQMLQGVNPDQTAYDQRMTQLEEAYKGTMGKGEAYKQQLEQAGVPEAQKRLADLNILMAQQQAAFNQGMLDTEGKVIPMRFITGQQAQMQKQYAVTAGNTAMMAQALQGNITMAKQTAMDTVDLEYADREAELNMQKQMLELNYDKLTRSEKKRADELNYLISQEEKYIEEQKNTKKEINDILLQGVQLGLDEKIIENIKNAATPEEAISYLGPTFLEARLRAEEQEAFENALKTQQLAISRINAAKSSTSPASKGILSSNTQAVIENPLLYKDFTPTQKQVVIAELQAAGYDTTRLGDKPLSSGDVLKINEFNSAISDIKYLKDVIEKNTDKLGPITGLEVLNPWSEKKKIQADIDRIKQTVGKSLEGGVLRKEDEEKYKKILAQITDTPATAAYKVDSLLSALQRNLEDYVSLQTSAGRAIDLTSPLTKKGETTINEVDLRTKYNY